VAAVHLLSAAPTAPERDPRAHLDLEQMRSCARVDRFGQHHLIDDPGKADIVLFVETSTAAGPYFEHVRRHPVYRGHRARSYLFSSTDRVVPFLPGVYASVERRWYWPTWTRSGHYLGVREGQGRVYDAARTSSLLFSFVGSGDAHRVRKRILRLGHPHALLLDSAAERLAVRRGERDRVAEGELAGRYVESIVNSAFVLCPRGGGTSTFRLFETMMLGRAPVIVSDEWVPPPGPDWESFSLRVREADVDRIPALLEARVGSARAMGVAARAAWLEWFSERVSFHRTVEVCLDLATQLDSRTGIRSYAPHLQMLRPYHAARWLAWRRPGRRR
jgi:hypothetical protein